MAQTLEEILQAVDNYGGNEFITSPKRLPAMSPEQATQAIRQAVDEAMPEPTTEDNAQVFINATEMYRANLMKFIEGSK